MPPNTNLERKTDTGFYSYIFVAPHNNSIFDYESIFEHNNCSFRGVILLSEDYRIGKYLFKDPLKEDVLRDFKSAGCEIYSKI